MSIHDDLKAKLAEFERASKQAQRVLDTLAPDAKRFEELRAALCGSSKLAEDMQRRLMAEGEAAAKHIAAANNEPRLKVPSLFQPKRRRRPGF